LGCVRDRSGNPFFELFLLKKRLGADSPTGGNAQKILEFLFKKVNHKLHKFSQILFFFDLNSENLFEVSFGNNLWKFVKFAVKKLYTKLTLTDSRFKTQHCKVLFIFAPLYSII